MTQDNTTTAPAPNDTDAAHAARETRDTAASSKKLPSLKRRPAGLKKSAQDALERQTRELTAAGIADAISGSEDAPETELAAAREWLAERDGVDPVHVWWVVAQRENEAQQSAALGLDVAGGDEDSVARACRDLRARYVYAARRDEVWDRCAGDWISTRALSNAQAHAMPVDDEGRAYDAMRLLTRDPDADRVHNERYMPGVHDEIAHADGVDWLNVWKPSELDPKAGDPKPMLDHILYLCGGRREVAAHLTNWLAYMYQNPGAKMSYAPLIISKSQGVGKDAFADAASRIFGEWNAPRVTEDMISEGRYEFMRRAQLVVVSETMSGDRKDLAHKLKPLITQPTVTVNEKNVKPYDVRNHANFLMFSNHEAAAHIEDQDRRYFVVICDRKPCDPQYYVELYDYIEGSGLAGFAAFLRDRDLSDFNPKAPAPDTPDKGVVKAATRGGVEAWLEDAWESRAAPFDRDVVNLRDALTAAIDARGPRMTTQQIGQFLKRVGGGDLGRVRMPRGARVRLWAARDYEKFAAGELDAAAAYENPTTFEHRRHLSVVAAE